MTVLNPLLLLGALGVALPILAHLINRQQVKRTDWAAMQFLNAQVRVRSRQLRLRDLVLLVMRCLAVLLFVFALARPATDQAEWTWLPGEEHAGVVIAIDASYSMGQSDGNTTRFERALDRARAIGDQIKPGNPLTLVMLGGRQRVVLRNVAFDSGRFARALDEQTPAPEPLDLDSVPKGLETLAQDMDALRKEVYFITDTQADAWEKPGTPFKQSLKDLSQEASVFLVPVVGSDANLAVTDLQLVSGTLRKGSIARYQATVQNYGSSPVSDVEVRCRVEGVQIDAKRIPIIPAGGSETVSLFVPLYNAGPTRLTAEITDEALTTDNIRRAVAVVRDRVTVLCVDGSTGDGGRLIVAALEARADRAKDEGYVVRPLPWSSFTTDQLDGVDVVVLSDVPEITPVQAEQLERFVREGKGLVWFAGDNVKSSKWNELLDRSAVGLLPASLGSPADARDSLGVGKPLDPDMLSHAVCRPLRSLPEDLLSETRFLTRLGVEPAQTSFAVLNLAGSRSPLLLEQSLGRGHVFMFTTSAHTAWNNMAQTPVFPMLMQQIVTYLAGREFERPRIVGDALALSYVEQPDATDAVFDTPSRETITVPVREHRGDYVALLDRSAEAGFYEARVSVQSAGMPIPVNVDTAESNIACVSTEVLRQSVEETGLTISSSGADLVADIATARTGRTSWRAFMIAALVLLIAESLLADRKHTRSRTPSADRLSPQPEGV